MPILEKTLRHLTEKDPTLTVLNLSRHYPLSIADMQALANALRGNPYIAKLVLCEDGIEDEGARILSEVLPTMSSLVELDVSVNNIGDKGAAALFHVAVSPHVPTLRILNIAANSVTDKAAGQLLENQTLHCVNLDGNSVSPALIARIDVQLESNETRELRAEFSRFIENLSSPDELELALSAAKESLQARAGKESVPVMQ
jgi:Ran GTPase-activating protein (RanGAP) involved in mRNA processing and transport